MGPRDETWKAIAIKFSCYMALIFFYKGLIASAELKWDHLNFACLLTGVKYNDVDCNLERRKGCVCVMRETTQAYI